MPTELRQLIFSRDEVAKALANYREDAEDSIREAIKTGKTLLQARTDFNYHALHHTYPTVPHYRLRRFKRALHRHGVVYTGRRLRGYVSFLVNHLLGPAPTVGR